MKNIILPYNILRNGNVLKSGYCLQLLIILLLLCNMELVEVVAAKEMKILSMEQKVENVKGIVWDSNGDPLVGVTIRVVETARGTTTDVDGRYSLKVESGQTLEFSYVGMKKKTVKVGKKEVINVTLDDDAIMLNEVVSIGYGTMKRSDLTGAVVSISGEELEKTVATTLDQILQGRVAGLNMVQNSGMPGGGTSVQIRGVSSINNTNEPIFVVDGVILSGATGSNDYNALSSINPRDIESIEILKDASATAIYGSQGANGVVLITMKKGVAGKPNISFGGYYAIQTLPMKIDVMNLSEYANHVNNFNEARGYENDYRDDYSHPERLGEGTDWQDEIFHNAAMQNYNLSVRGGTKIINYNLSGGYLNQDGIALGSGFDRFTLRMQMEVQATEQLRVGGSVNYSYTNQNSGISGALSNALFTPPHIPVRNPDGSYAGPDSEGLSAQRNPVAVANLTKRTNERAATRSNLFLQLKPFKDITFRTEFTVNNDIDNYEYFLPAYQMGWSLNPFATTEHNKSYRMNWGWKNILTINHSFRKKSNMTLMLGHEMTDDKSDNLRGKRTHGSSVLTGLNAGDPAYATNGGGASNRKFLSYFGRLFYNFKDRYQSTVTFRADGSSRFAKGNRWGMFPSIAFAWRVSEEKFMKPMRNTINNLKLRVSYGLVGNSNVSDFAYQTMFNNLVSQWGTSYQTANMPNRDLTWERTKSWNLGVDLGLFKNRVEFIFDVYRKKVDDLLLQLSLPGYLGTQNNGSTSSMWANIGAMENRGFEFTLNTVNISKRDLSWRSNIVFNYNKNKVVKMNLANAYIDKVLSGYVVTRTTVGKPISQFYGMQIIGRIDSAGDYLSDNGDGTSTVIKATPTYRKGQIVSNTDTQLANNSYIGDFLFKDVNSDGLIDEKDCIFLGNPMPKFTMGFNSTLKWKDFDFSLSMYGSYGNDLVNWQNKELWNPNTTHNLRTEASKFCRIGYLDGNPKNTNVWNVYVLPGASPVMFRSSLVKTNENERMSDRYIQDGSYLRIKNIILGYTMPRKWSRKIGLQNLRVYANIQNVYTFTRYDGHDPEVGSTSGQNMLMYGVDTGRYPSPRIFTFGVDLTFNN